MRKNNKGLSLVEVVVVISIISVITALVSIGVGSAFSKPADECAQKIVSTLNNVRISTMGKQSCEVVISQADATAPVYVCQNINGSTGVAVKISEKNVTVDCYLSDGSSFSLANAGAVTVSYKRTTGGMNKVGIQNTGLAADAYLTKIVVSKGTKTKTINLAYLTGKVTVD